MPSQLGCLASHYLLWQECAASGKPLIVIEDDAILKDNFPEMLTHAQALSQAWSLIWLHEWDHPHKKKDAWMHIGKIGPFALVRKLKGHWCTVCYLLNPEGAAALLDYCRTWIYPVDDTMFRFYEHGVENILIQPACVGHNHESQSDIVSSDKQPRKRLQDKLRSEFYKRRDKTRCQLYNLRFRIRHWWRTASQR